MILEKNGGDGEIRTLDTLLRYTHFPGVLLQPLGHISKETNRDLLYLTQRQLSPLLALGLSQGSLMSSGEPRIHSYASEIVLDPIGFLLFGVPTAGLEPAPEDYCLKVARLPIPPSGHFIILFFYHMTSHQVVRRFSLFFCFPHC